MAITTERRLRYQAIRREKYASDPEYRAHVLARNKKQREANRDAINAARRERWANDPDFREKQNSTRRPKPYRAYALKKNYGLTLEQYDEMLEAQGGVCAICAEPPTEFLCVDHCHSTLRLRGLLCRKCNTGLGCYEDSVERMKLAMAYLERHRVN